MYLKNVQTHGFRAASVDPLRCELPGRFSVLLGGNSGGKTTLIDSIVLAHRDVFPGAQRPSAALLSKDVTARSIDIEYTLETPERRPHWGCCATGPSRSVLVDDVDLVDGPDLGLPRRRPG